MADASRGGSGAPRGHPGTERAVLRAHAKTNLRLRVLGRTDDGYHQLETVFLRLGLHDDVEVDLGPGDTPPGLSVSVAEEPEWPGREDTPDGPENLCWRAAELFFSAVERRPAARIRLRKRIPPASGLGGGSADAAAVLTGLNRLHGGRLDRVRLLELGGRLGSDVPFCLTGLPMALGWERGRRLLPLPPLPSRPALVLVPPVAVGTAEAYRWVDERRSGSVRGPSAARLPWPEELVEWGTVHRWAVNDFQEVVHDRRPAVAGITEWLRERGASPAGLSGSGSAVIGYFDEAGLRDDALELAGELDGVAALATEAPARG